jgi:hypothetical protein
MSLKDLFERARRRFETIPLVFWVEGVSQTMTSAEARDLLDLVIRFKVCRLKGTEAGALRCKECPLNRILFDHTTCEILEEMQQRAHVGYFAIKGIRNQGSLKL